MKQGWSRLTTAQRVLFGFWAPSLVMVCFLGAVACFFLGFGWIAIVLLLISVIAALSVVVTIRDGVSSWPRAR